MTEPCQGPDPHPRKPRLDVPAGATNSHFHLFGPASRYPMVEDREYTPPPATPGQVRHLLDTLGIARGVVIQPSIYGHDNRAQLEGAAEIGIPMRAVVVVPHDTSDREMAKLHDQGARALRFILAHPGGLPASDLERSAARAEEMGWHIQLLAKGAQLVELKSRIAELACPAVIDHIGMIRPADGLRQPAFQALLRLLRRGHWVELRAATGCRRTPRPIVISLRTCGRSSPPVRTGSSGRATGRMSSCRARCRTRPISLICSPTGCRMRTPAAASWSITRRGFTGSDPMVSDRARIYLGGVGGATAASPWPLAFSASATKPEAFISSTKARR